jgi:hypothetical protein
MIDRDGDALSDAIDDAGNKLGATLADWGPAPLKRVPKPFDPDHAHGDLLKRKGLTVSAPLPADWRDAGLLPTLNRMVPVLLPIWQAFDSTFSDG